MSLKQDLITELQDQLTKNYMSDSIGGVSSIKLVNQ